MFIFNMEWLNILSAYHHILMYNFCIITNFYFVVPHRQLHTHFMSRNVLDLML